jgi:hypothetical protein
MHLHGSTVDSLTFRESSEQDRASEQWQAQESDVSQVKCALSVLSSCFRRPAGGLKAKQSHHEVRLGKSWATACVTIWPSQTSDGSLINPCVGDPFNFEALSPAPLEAAHRMIVHMYVETGQQGEHKASTRRSRTGVTGTCEVIGAS